MRKSETYKAVAFSLVGIFIIIVYMILINSKFKL